MTIPSEPTADITTTINEEKLSARVPIRQSLVDWLRHGIGLTGSHVGCEHGVCGACHVIVNDKVVRACMMLAVQADLAKVVTIDARNPSQEVSVLQNAFYERAALQCGFCTPGMILQASELLRGNRNPSRDDIREALSGNYCRCTGYHAIIDAVETAAGVLHAETPT
jgi:aerobic-type carbon monoxide dehydrogenase small subunit (CoxS/CutS family)